MAILSGSVFFRSGSKNYLFKEQIFGTGYFYENSENIESICTGLFFCNSKNIGTVHDAKFFENSLNSGVILNTGYVEFLGNSINCGYISGSALFLDTSNNAGAVSGNALFANTATNIGGSVGSSGVYTNNQGQFDNLTTTQISNLTTNQILSYTTSDIASLDSDQVQFLSTSIFAALSTSQIAALSSSVISALDTLQFQQFDFNDISALSSSQIASLSTNTLIVLTSSQASGLQAEDIVALTTSQIASLSTGVLASLTNSQAAGLQAEDIVALTTSQIASLSTGVFNQLTESQTQALQPEDISTLSVEQFQSINTTAISVFNTPQIQQISLNNIRGITTSQITSINTSAIQALTTNQIQVIQNDDISVLTTKQIQSLTVQQLNSLTSRPEFFNPTPSALNITRAPSKFASNGSIVIGLFIFDAIETSLRRSTDGGKTFSTVYTFNRPAGTSTVQGTRSGKIIYANGKFIALTFGRSIISLDNGLTWNSYNFPQSLGPIQFNYVNNKFVAIGTALSFSDDGIQWTTPIELGNISVDADTSSQIIYHNNLYYAIIFGQMPAGVYSSPDLINWTIRYSMQFASLALDSVIFKFKEKVYFFSEHPSFGSMYALYSTNDFSSFEFVSSFSSFGLSSFVVNNENAFLLTHDGVYYDVANTQLAVIGNNTLNSTEIGFSTGYEIGDYIYLYFGNSFFKINKNLSIRQTNALTQNQIQALSSTQISSLTTSQITDFDNLVQVHAFDITSFTPQQIDALENKNTATFFQGEIKMIFLLSDPQRALLSTSQAQVLSLQTRIDLTLKNGPYSDNYFCYGLFNETYNSLSPDLAQDDCKWYTYAYGVATAANGAYSNGYFANGECCESYTCATPQDTIDSCYFTYFGGTSYLACDIFSNGAFNLGNLDINYTCSTPQDTFDSNYYTFCSGISTQASGLYSNCAFNAGEPDAAYTCATPTQVQDNSSWYTFSNGSPTVANGLYSTCAFTNGECDAAYTCATPQDTIDSNCYTFYCGTATQANGLYSNGAFCGGAFDSSVNHITPQSVLVVYDSCYKFYTFLSGESTLATGAYTNGYFINGERSAAIQCCNGYWNLTPMQTQDDNLKYIYANQYAGDGCFFSANGLFSNFAFVDGLINSGYTCLCPTSDIVDALSVGGASGGDPDPFFTYCSGVASLANGFYSIGHFSNGHMSFPFQTPPFVVDTIDSNYYYVDSVDGQIVLTQASGLYSICAFYSGDPDTTYSCAIPQDTIDCNYYTFCSGTPTLANGPYSNGYFDNGVICDTYYEPIPRDTIDSNHYTFCNGSGIQASGLYASGAFNAGDLDLTYTCSIPQVVQEPGCSYRFTFCNGISDESIVPTTVSDGVYSYGAYVNNEFDSSYCCGVPQIPSNGGSIYYTYYVGFATPASGLYSFCAFNAAGEPDGAYTCATPQDTIDCNYFTFSNGTATQANGLYSNGAFSAGDFSSEVTCAIPQDTIDSNFYTFAAGVAIQANGPYSVGYYVDGDLDTSYNSLTPIQAENGSWYTYISGVALLAYGAFSNGYYYAGVISEQTNGSFVTQDTSSCTLFTNGVAGEPGSGTC